LVDGGNTWSRVLLCRKPAAVAPNSSIGSAARLPINSDPGTALSEVVAINDFGLLPVGADEAKALYAWSICARFVACQGQVRCPPAGRFIGRPWADSSVP
jgi:hypothetical protein